MRTPDRDTRSSRRTGLVHREWSNVYRSILGFSGRWKFLFLGGSALVAVVTEFSIALEGIFTEPSGRVGVGPPTTCWSASTARRCLPCRRRSRSTETRNVTVRWCEQGRRQDSIGPVPPPPCLGRSSVERAQAAHLSGRTIRRTPDGIHGSRAHLTLDVHTTNWVKVKNPAYSQIVGRDELFAHRGLARPGAPVLANHI